MKNKKLLIILIVALLLINAALLVYQLTCKSCRSGDLRNQIIGGDKDEHGCYVAAGYSWCETKQKCYRAWEENCEEFSIAPTPVADFVKTGNLVATAAGGSTDEGWSLLYEEPGKPALKVNLIFSNESMCDQGSGQQPCLILSSLTIGERVSVSGIKSEDGSRIMVIQMTQVK